MCTSSKKRVLSVTEEVPHGLDNCPPSRYLEVWGKKRIKNIRDVDLSSWDNRINTRKFNDSYIVGDELGRGKFGVVYLCTEIMSGRKLACKVFSKAEIRDTEVLEEIHREVAVMIAVQGHKNVVGLKSVFEDSLNIYLVMELCNGGDLFGYINRNGSFREDDAADIFGQLLDALIFCHDRCIVHRDIKPENILLWREPDTIQPQVLNEALRCKLAGRNFQRYIVKLADFGLAISLKRGYKVKGIAGSPMYMAPEVISGSYDHSADIWSLGVILYILLCGKAPFFGQSDLETVKKTEEGRLDFSGSAWSAVSPMAVDLVSRLLKKRPKDRLTLQSVLLHPWMIYHRINSMMKNDHFGLLAC